MFCARCKPYSCTALRIAVCRPGFEQLEADTLTTALAHKFGFTTVGMFLGLLILRLLSGGLQNNVVCKPIPRVAKAESRPNPKQSGLLPYGRGSKNRNSKMACPGKWETWTKTCGASPSDRLILGHAHIIRLKAESWQNLPLKARVLVPRTLSGYPRHVVTYNEAAIQLYESSRFVDFEIRLFWLRVSKGPDMIG